MVNVLYAFAIQSERTLFRSLLKVSGIGAKVALAILSGMSPDEFSCCAETEDVASLVRLPGLGRKTAERLIVEMRDRLAKLGDLSAVGMPSQGEHSARPVTASSDAVSALVALGYKPQDASRVVKAVKKDGMDSETLILAALQGTVQ